MTEKKYIIFNLLILILGLVYSGEAQIDQVASVYLKDVKQTRPNELQFDLQLYRSSTSWHYWANGSFEFTTDSLDFKFDNTSLLIDLIPNTSQLDLSPITGVLPFENYLLTPRIFKNRISVTVAGPEKFEDCVKVGLDTLGIRLGTFRIYTADGSPIPTRLKWLEPFYYYQACAYKLPQDSLIIPSVIINDIHNNIEMDNDVIPKVSYKVNSADVDSTVVINFRADYIGSKAVKLSYTSTSEYMVKGWRIRRALRDFDQIIPLEQLNYSDLIADFTKGVPPHDGLIGLGTRRPGRDYEFKNDTVPRRGVTYAYRLEYEDLWGRTPAKYWYATTPVPNAVIIAGKNSPNPFSGTTKIEFILDDAVRLTAKVYDLTGKLVETLVDNQELQRGRYGYDSEKDKLYSDYPEGRLKDGKFTIEFNASSLSQQGLYNIILIGIPINDSSVEISKAIIKAQYIR